MKSLRPGRTALPLLMIIVLACAWTSFASDEPDEPAKESRRRSSHRAKRGRGTRRPSSVEGDSNSSEFFHQAPGGRWEFTPGLGVTWGTPVKRAGRASYTGTPLVFTAEYGVSQIMSVALNLRFDSISYEICGASGACSTVRSSGLFDPSVDLKFRFATRGGHFLWGLNVASAVEKGKIDSSGDTNNATGGSSIAPYIGYEIILGSGRAGAKLSNDLYKGDAQRESAGTSFAVSGGQVLQAAAFYEFDSGSATYGGSLAYQSVSEQKSTANGITQSSNDANTALILQFYVPFHATGITYLPALGYTNRTYSSSSYAYSAKNELFAGCGFRF